MGQRGPRGFLGVIEKRPSEEGKVEDTALSVVDVDDDEKEDNERDRVRHLSRASSSLSVSVFFSGSLPFTPRQQSPAVLVR